MVLGGENIGDEMETLINRIKRHEGFRAEPYHCSAGKLTIGYGHRLNIKWDRSIADGVLRDDLAKCWVDLKNACPWAVDLPKQKQEVLVEMILNLGLSGFLGFRKTIAALRCGDFKTAATEMLDSRWHEQVGQRARTLADIIRK